jgi:hypothetical protein
MVISPPGDTRNTHRSVSVYIRLILHLYILPWPCVRVIWFVFVLFVVAWVVNKYFEAGRRRLTPG